MGWLAELFVGLIVELVRWPFENRRKRVARANRVPDPDFRSQHKRGR